MSDAKVETTVSSRVREMGPIGWIICIVVFGAGFLIRLWAALIAFHATAVVLGAEPWVQPILGILRVVAAVLTFSAPVMAEVVLFALHWFVIPGLLPQPFIVAVLGWCCALLLVPAYFRFLRGK